MAPTTEIEPTQKTLQELRRVLTIGEAFEVVRRWGNRRWRVPARVDADSPLALTLGLDCAQRLVQAFGNQVLDMPSERAALRRMRDEAIWHQCVVLGRSRADVALEFGTSRQHVKWVLDKVRVRQEQEGPERAMPGSIGVGKP